MNLSNPIIDLTTGNPMQRQTVVNFQVRDIIVGALLANDNALSPDDKLHRATLAETIQYSDSPTLSASDVELIKTVCYRFTPTGMLNAVLREIDPPTVQ